MWQWSRVSPEVFYVRHFPTCSTLQHPSCRVAQGLLTHALPSDKPRQLPSESFSNVYIQFSVHIRSTVKSAYISACESAHVSACMQFFTCCDPVWNVLITSLQTFSALINTRSSWRFQLSQTFAVSHFSTLHEVGGDAGMKFYSQNCIIRFDNCHK